MSNNEREIASVSFTINGDFIANAIEAYSKMNEDIAENQQLKFEALLDEGENVFEVRCTLIEKVLH